MRVLYYISLDGWHDISDVTSIEYSYPFITITTVDHDNIDENGDEYSTYDETRLDHRDISKMEIIFAP